VKTRFAAGGSSPDGSWPIPGSMETRARISHLPLPRAALMAALALILLPLMAAPADAAKRKSPVVKKVTPKQAWIGETLTIRGRHFQRGRNKNTVVFKRKGGRAVFVKAEIGTSRLLKVELTDKLESALVVRNGAPAPTQFQIRVLAKKLGKRYTARRKSPTIGPRKPPAPPAPPAAQPDGDCDGDGQVNKVDGDDDNDLLMDADESALRLDGCKADSDGDGVGDGYEHKSAVDLNGSALPYPAKLPYPNALFQDSEVDYDGDGLTLLDEFKLWVGSGENTLDLSYSDGNQHSRTIGTAEYAQAPSPASPHLWQHRQWQFLSDSGAGAARDMNRDGAVAPIEAYYYDLDYNGKLSDDERDEDADGIPNWSEAHGFMTTSWWKGIYSKEKTYVVPFAGTEIDDRDTDGDGVLDGADDQDHDLVPNIAEMSRRLAAGLAPGVTWSPGQPVPANDPLNWVRPIQVDKEAPGNMIAAETGWVQPFNPCLPDAYSPICVRYVPADNLFPPFDPKGPRYNVFN
jgi:IPT/TIG domain